MQNTGKLFLFRVDKYVVKTSKEQKAKLDTAVGRYLFSQNVAFSGVENPHFVKLCSSLRPGYQPPNRKQIAGPILDQVYGEIQTSMNSEISKSKSVLVLSQDGWSSVMNNPIIAHSLFVGGKSYLYSLENCGSNSKTAEYCFNLTDNIIGRLKDELGKDVGGIVTDNEAKMRQFRAKVDEKYPDILTYGCSAHYMNLLENAVTDPDKRVMKHVVEVSKHFRNVHKSLGMLRERGGLTPQLPNDTRWTSQIICLEVFLKNHDKYAEIRDELYDRGDNTIPVNVGRIIDDRQLKRLAGDWLDMSKCFAVALDRLQSDNCSVGESIHIWLNLMKNEKLQQFQDEIKRRFDQYREPFMVIAYMMDPRYQEEWPEFLANEFSYLEDEADEWLDNKDTNGEMMEPYIKFKSKEKDSQLYPGYLFKLSTTSSPAEWWSFVDDRNSRSKKISSEFTRLMIRKIIASLK